MQPSRISPVLLKSLLTSRTWKIGVGVIGSRAGGFLLLVKKS